MKKPSDYSKISLILFFVIASTLFFSLNFSHKKNEINKTSSISTLLTFEQLKFADLSVKSAELAKQSKLFWADDQLGRGVALKLLADQNLFSSIFPGYPDEMRTDSELWNSYFKNVFSPSSHFSKIAPENLLVTYSWTGCLDIYSRYGADVIIFGNSEVYRAIIIDELYRFFKNTQTMDNPKILFCVTGLMPNEMVRQTAMELIKFEQPKPKVILWGYSFWSSFIDEKGSKHLEKSKEDELNQYRKRARNKFNSQLLKKFNQWHTYKLSSLFPKITWDNFMHTSFQQFRSKENHAEVDDVTQSVFHIPQDINRNEELLKKTIYAHPLNNVGFSSENFDVNALQENLQKTKAILTDLGQNVFIYLTPVTPFHTMAAPKAMHNSIKNALHNLSAKNVFIRTEDMINYELNHSDFLKPAKKMNTLLFDSNHVNFSGAKKITQNLAKWIQSSLMTEENNR